MSYTSRRGRDYHASTYILAHSLSGMPAFMCASCPYYLCHVFWHWVWLNSFSLHTSSGSICALRLSFPGLFKSFGTSSVSRMGNAASGLLHCRTDLTTLLSPDGWSPGWPAETRLSILLSSSSPEPQHFTHCPIQIRLHLV
ncbi:unnamed protein product [Protopolystoma xenopodis]|uniref:Uncharacterized protein n=1 Tax=Protopolystoma xenopodis TaxID=117903 RepID=A0A3S5AYV9_9PLAT|nr:unnamed protein product [Protopolystoma xenopodis]